MFGQDKRSLIAILESKHPTARIQVVKEEVDGFRYRAVFVEPVRGDGAEAAHDAYGTARICFGTDLVAVVVKDANGQHWGTDWSRERPPGASLMPRDPIDESNSIMRVGIETGAFVKDRSGNWYKVIAARPWGPADQRQLVGDYRS